MSFLVSSSWMLFFLTDEKNIRVLVEIHESLNFQLPLVSAINSDSVAWTMVFNCGYLRLWDIQGNAVAYYQKNWVFNFFHNTMYNKLNILHGAIPSKVNNIQLENHELIMIGPIIITEDHLSSVSMEHEIKFCFPVDHFPSFLGYFPIWKASITQIWREDLVFNDLDKIKYNLAKLQYIT